MHLEVTTSRNVIVDDIARNTHERESVAFCSSCRVSLREFCGSAMGLKECIIDSVKTLYSQVMEKVQSTVDSNGRMKRIAGCEVPVHGNWRG
jgi:cytidine deaminase